MWQTLLWGCLGAVFPEIVRQFELRNQDVGVPVGYIVRSLAFVLASGAVVLALPGSLSPLTAIYAGAAAPALVAAGSRAILAGRQSLGDQAGGSGGNSSPEPGPDDVRDMGSNSGDKYVLLRNRFMKFNGWERFFESL